MLFQGPCERLLKTTLLKVEKNNRGDKQTKH